MSGAIAIGNRLELFVDDFLLERAEQAHLKPNVPLRKEIVLEMDQPWEGRSSPFLDTRPGVPVNERYKALAGSWPAGLVAFVSEDGLNWTRKLEHPEITDGAFDSLNQFEDVPMEHFYTNVTLPCPGAEHIYLSFPMRFMPERCKVEGFAKTGVSDSVLMSSRDGVHWNRPFMSSWIHAGRDERNWSARSLVLAHGILATSADEFSMYVVEHYEWDDVCLRRYVLPRHRFGSINAGYAGGSVLTKPLTMHGDKLVLNYSTSGVGSIEVQLEDKAGQPLPGFAFADFGELYGDELDYEVNWKSGRSIAELSTIPIRIHFKLKDADIYAFQFR